MKFFNNYFLLFSLITFIFFTASCGTDQREEVMERYSSGAKFIVGIYEGTGTNETLLERHYFQENGKLGRIEKLEEGNSVNYLDLYPETRTKEGLKDFLNGSWVGINKINYSSYDVYEVLRLIFDTHDLQKQIQVIVCDNDNYRRRYPSIVLNSNVNYKEDLKVEESGIEFQSAIPTESWRTLVSLHNLNKSDFSTTIYSEVYSELEKYRFQDRNTSPIDTTSFLGRFIKLDRIEISNNSIGDTVIPYHGDSVVGTDEWFNYTFETGIASVMDLKFKKGARTGSCGDLEKFLDTEI